MKILKIEFENINSLKGSHEIDFTRDPFTTNSLFAITGPTGSGKSSILDVISLALFGKIPRIPGSRMISKSDIEKLGTILTRNQKQAVARVTYQCNQGVFSSQWSISTNRNNKLRDYEMELKDHQENALIDLKKSDVPGRNEELIGLNYDQFIKAVLLAQGEFAQFLKAKKEDRGELLEKITGTGIYRQLGIKAFEKNKQANQQIQEQQNEIRIIQNKLIEEEDLKELQLSFEKKTEKGNQLQKEIDSLKKHIELKQNISKQLAEIIRLEKQKTQALTNLETFENEHGAPLKAHEKVQDHAEQLRNWKQAEKQLEKYSSEAKQLDLNLEKNSEKVQDLKKEIKQLIKEDPEDAKIEAQLNAFRNKVLQLKNEKDAKGNEYALKRSEFLAEVKELDFKLNEKEPEESLSQLKILKTDLSTKLADLASTLELQEKDNIQHKTQAFQQKLRSTREAARDYSAIAKYNRDLSELQDKISKIQPDIAKFPEQIEVTGKQVEHLKTQLELLNSKKKIQMLEASLEEHRHQLKDGEACPLCGALSHPYAAHLPEKDDSLEVEIANKEKELETVKENWNNLKLKLQNLKEQLQELQTQKENTEKNLRVLNSGFSEKYSDLVLFKSEEKWQNACEVLENKIGQLSAYEKEQKQLQSIIAAIPLLRDLIQILKEGKRLKSALQELYAGEDIQADIQQFQNAWIRLIEEKKNIFQSQTKLKEDKNSVQETLSELTRELTNKLSDSGFGEISLAFNALIPEQECNRLRSQRQQIQKEIDNSQASIQLLKNQLEDLQKQDSEKEQESLETELKAVQDKAEVLTKECRELERLLKNNAEHLERLKELRNEIAEKEKETRRWRLLNELIGDSKGKKFNDFAQDLTLSRLLSLANIRLKELSDRYLIAKPEEEEDDGLVAVDEHMGGQRRSVKTLSGGETFLLSLSMALALSDLASKSVEINSLFIDEGFGTLDPETLDQTLDTLERLQAESSKTIGVISHVDSLKERISTQIQLTRNGQGYSSLQIK
ncbi:AAA family ATPase [Christiangramia aquimixticola]|uniref:AAA family ATPase n=1 Tax=Christiangramia aquimixticola TaxID=1697558 RepID=UPI003AA8CFA4